MRTTVYLLCSILLFASCGEKSTIEKKTAELTKLKKERSELDDKIAKLEAEVNENNPVNATAIAVMEVYPQPFKAYVEVQAQITGDENVLATPQALGVVKNIHVHTGQKVAKGQTLAVLDASAIEQQIKAQEAQLLLYKELYEKQKKLWAQNIGTEVQLLQAKTQYEAAVSQKQALVEQRNMYTIKSPITGVVDVMNLKVGDAAAPGVNGIRVVSKDKLKAVANLGETYLGKIHQGDLATILINGGDDSIQARLSYVSQSVDAISRAFNVEVRLGSNSRLHPNMSAKMKIANYENKNALLVPVSVIQKTNEGDFLFVADGNTARSVQVETGMISNGMVEVLKGLNPGDKVITAGYEELDNGEAVAIQ